MTTLQPTPSEHAEPINLTQLRPGECGRLHAAHLAGSDSEVLTALGLAERSRFRVSKTGDPWILEVRSTRIGLSAAIARSLLVVREILP